MHDLRHSTFRAMGTDVELVGPADAAAFSRSAAAAREIFESDERRYSRFRTDSELSRLNASAGSWNTVSAPLAELLAFALAAARRTGGRFDPTVLDAVLAAGYDRDFDELISAARVVLRPARPCGRFEEVELEGNTVRLPAGVGIDLGGVAKGWSVDRAAEAAVSLGLPWALVNAGGDLRIAGDAPREISVAVEDPEDATLEAGRVRLEVGALATSSTTRRAWGEGLHHLIDPLTGAPASGDVLQATVWAPTCAEAEIDAKDALLSGPRSLERLRGVLILRDGRIVTNVATDEETAA